MHSSDNIVAFIDNAEDRMVIEYDAEYYEERFEDPSTMLHHILGNEALRWTITRTEYTGDTYIITIESLWM